MKISAIPAGANAAIAAAAAARTNNNNKIDLPTNNYHPHYGSAEKMTQPKHSTFPNAMQKKRRDSSTNSSFCSACTESDDSDSSLPSAKIHQRSRKVPPTTPKRNPQKNGMPPITVTMTGIFTRNFSLSIRDSIFQVQTRMTMHRVRPVCQTPATMTAMTVMMIAAKATRSTGLTPATTTIPERALNNIVRIWVKADQSVSTQTRTMPTGRRVGLHHSHSNSIITFHTNRWHKRNCRRW